MRSPDSPPSPPSVSFAERTVAASRAAGDAPWDSDGHLLVASSPAEAAPPPRDVKKRRSFFTAKSRALAGRLNAPPIQERAPASPRIHEGAPSPVRRPKPQSKEFFDRQQAAVARRRAPPVVSEAPTTTSTFGSFLERQRDSSKRRHEEPTPRDPIPPASPRHAAIAPKVPQAPPIYSVQRAKMISEGVRRARSKIESEMKKPYTYKPVLADSSKEAMDEVKPRTEVILRKASEKRQRMYEEITSARATAEKEAEQERRAAKSSKARARRPAWLQASEKLMANFYKRNAREQAKDVVPEDVVPQDVEPDHGDADVDLDLDASDDE